MDQLQNTSKKTSMVDVIEPLCGSAAEYIKENLHGRTSMVDVIEPLCGSAAEYIKENLHGRCH